MSEKQPTAMAKPIYQAVCFTCYTCIIATTTSKRKAECSAVSHMNAYGHQTAVQTKDKDK